MKKESSQTGFPWTSVIVVVIVGAMLIGLRYTWLHDKAAQAEDQKQRDEYARVIQ